MHQQSGVLIPEATTGGTLTTEYIWLGTLPLATITDADTVAPRVYWLHSDHLGSPEMATDDTGLVTWNPVQQKRGPSVKRSRQEGREAKTASPSAP